MVGGPIPDRVSRSRRRRAGSVVLALLVVAAACSPEPATDPEVDTRFADHAWTEVTADAPWGRRAGVEAVALDGSFFLLGGRTPNPFTPFPKGPIPGDSTIWGDVWRSDDDGRSWTEVEARRTVAGPLVPRGRRAGGSHGAAGWSELPCSSRTRPAVPTRCCFPRFTSNSDFFDDVWASTDGAEWELLAEHAPWAGRAGLSAAVLDGEIYVLGGSVNDDPSIVGGPPSRRALQRRLAVPDGDRVGVDDRSCTLAATGRSVGRRPRRLPLSPRRRVRLPRRPAALPQRRVEDPRRSRLGAGHGVGRLVSPAGPHLRCARRRDRLLRRVRRRVPTPSTCSDVPAPPTCGPAPTGPPGV